MELPQQPFPARPALLSVIPAQAGIQLPSGPFRYGLGPPASRVSPRQAFPFSCLAKQRNQKKARRLVPSLRYASGTLPFVKLRTGLARCWRGLAKLGLRPQTTPALIRQPLRYSLVSTRQRGANHQTTNIRKPVGLRVCGLACRPRSACRWKTDPQQLRHNSHFRAVVPQPPWQPSRHRPWPGRQNQIGS